MPNMRKFVNTNNMIYLSLVIVLVAVLILLVPLIVKKEQIKNFTMDTFNFVVLLLINVVLYFVNIKVGLVASVLILSLLIYAKLEGMTFSDARFYGERKENLESDTYKSQFKLPSAELEMHNKMKLPDGKLEIGKSMETAKINNLDEMGDNTAKEPEWDTNDSNKQDTANMATTTTLTETFENPSQPSNVDEYMKQLNKDSLTSPLKAQNHGFDVIGCRYDMAESAQNTAREGPPLAWNDTYKGETINGQLFYPLHG